LGEGESVECAASMYSVQRNPVSGSCQNDSLDEPALDAQSDPDMEQSI